MQMLINRVYQHFCYNIGNCLQFGCSKIVIQKSEVKRSVSHNGDFFIVKQIR